MNLIWIVMIAALFFVSVRSQQGGLQNLDEILQNVDLLSESSWMGVYINGEKVGYVHTELTRSEEGGYLVREFSRLAGAMMGVGQDMKMRMDVVTDDRLALISFDGYLEADPYTTAFAGYVADEILSIQVTAGGQTTEKSIPAPGPIYLTQAIKPLLQRGRLNQGDSITLAGFDPLSLKMQDLVVIGGDLKSYGPRMFDGRLVRGLTTRMAGFESKVYMDENGDILREVGPLGMVMKREEMNEALNLEGGSGSVDFLSIYAIKPVGTIERPRETVSARYRLKGIDIDQVIAASGRQRLVESDSSIIEVTTEPNPEIIIDGELELYVSDAPFIESQNRLIQETARRVVVGKSNLLDSLDALSDWVFRNVEKRPSAGIPSALAVLNTRQGDCNEHSVLLTALARSLGVPTRIQLGVVYQDGRFYYHAWTASLVDGKWMEFDPTFGQPRADAARIALAAGDMRDAQKLAGVVGRIEIEIIDTER